MKFKYKVVEPYIYFLIPNLSAHQGGGGWIFPFSIFVKIILQVALSMGEEPIQTDQRQKLLRILGHCPIIPTTSHILFHQKKKKPRELVIF